MSKLYQDINNKLNKCTPKYESWVNNNPNPWMFMQDDATCLDMEKQDFNYKPLYNNSMYQVYKNRPIYEYFDNANNKIIFIVIIAIVIFIIIKSSTIIYYI